MGRVACLLLLLFGEKENSKWPPYLVWWLQMNCFHREEAFNGCLSNIFELETCSICLTHTPSDYSSDGEQLLTRYIKYVRWYIVNCYCYATHVGRTRKYVE